MSEPMNPPPPFGGPSTPPPDAAQPPSRWKTLGVVLGLVGLALVASYFGLRRQWVAPPPEAPVVAPPVPQAAAVPPMVPVEERDRRVRELLGKLSSDPELAKWLQEQDLVRRFTTSVSNIAEGESPRMSLGFMAPAGAFEVQETNGQTTMHPSTYARYDTVARVIGSLDAQAAAQVYRELKPLIDGVYAEIAPPGQTFEATFGRAVQHLLAVPVSDEPAKLEAKGALYVYSAPELENLSRAQKHLLRMGPQNAQRIQEKLRDLQGALNLPVAGR